MWYHIWTGGHIMNISSDIKPISFLKSHAADILKHINDTHRPVVITQNGEPRAVLQDPESYDNMRKAIGLLKIISQGEEDIKQGKTKGQEHVFKGIENILAKQNK
jgi:prevent-host-death family protein